MMISLQAIALLMAMTTSQPRLGINLAGPVDWNTELPFVDVFRMSRSWISQRQGQVWGKGPPLTLDEHGWVTKLEPGCHVDTPMCTIEGGHYPAGTYTVLYEGEGEVDCWAAGRVRERAPGRMVVDVDPKLGPLWLRIRRVNPTNYVRNIRVIMPGFEESYATNPWRPGFLDQWRGVACIRFMDFMGTNGSLVHTWNDRPKLDDATWATGGSGGVPLELMCDLANRLETDAWFCIPHLADDDYVRHFAEQTRQLLDPRRKVYIEYSNEVWNKQFAQYKYASEQAEKPWQHTVIRSLQIFAIWEEVFGGRERLVRVLPSQAVNPYLTEQIVAFREAHKHADALAIAPYFGSDGKDAEKTAALGVDGVLDDLEVTRLPAMIQVMRQNKAIADKYGLKLVAYEAGQHLVAANNVEITKLFQAANRDPRMGEIYRRYYDAWAEAGGGLMCAFSSIGRWNKWGSWGLMQHADDDPEDYPKMKITLESMRKFNSKP